MIQIMLLICLILLNAFFAATEMAFVSLNDAKISVKAKEGDKKYIKIEKMLKSPSKFLATIQIGITLAGFLSSAFASDVFASELAKLLFNITHIFSVTVWQNVSIIVITIILSYFTLIFGELVPKRIAMENAEKFSLFSISIISALAKFMSPFVKFLTWSTDKVSKIFGVKKENEETQKEEKKPKLVIKNNDNDIIVGDTKNIETHIANCCLPVPGDEIVGYITKTSGISIHRKICSNIELFDDRIVEAFWNPNIDNKYSSELIIHTTSRENIVLDIVQTAATLNINVENVNLISKGANNVYSVDIVVANLEDLTKYMLNLQKIKYVNDVERIIK